MTASPRGSNYNACYVTSKLTKGRIVSYRLHIPVLIATITSVVSQGTK
jgi:hypothetical protein